MKCRQSHARLGGRQVVKWQQWRRSNSGQEAHLNDVPQSVKQIWRYPVSIQPEKLHTGQDGGGHQALQCCKRAKAFKHEQSVQCQLTFFLTAGSELCSPQQKVRSTRLNTSLPNDSAVFWVIVSYSSSRKSLSQTGFNPTGIACMRSSCKHDWKRVCEATEGSGSRP